MGAVGECPAGRLGKRTVRPGDLLALDVEGWIAWAEPYAYGVMGLKEWEFERISSTATFLKMLRGAVRRYELLVDLFGFARVDFFRAQGVKFRDGAVTFERVIGRPPVDLVDPPAPTAEERDEEEDRKRQQAALLAKAQMQLFEAQTRAARPDLIEGDDETPRED